MANEFNAGELENIRSTLNGTVEKWCSCPLTETARILFGSSSKQTEVRLYFDSKQVIVSHKEDPATYEIVFSDVTDVSCYSDREAFRSSVQFRKFQKKFRRGLIYVGSMEVFANGKIRAEV